MKARHVVGLLLVAPFLLLAGAGIVLVAWDAFHGSAKDMHQLITLGLLILFAVGTTLLNRESP